MRIFQRLLPLVVIAVPVFLFSSNADAQQYKLRQSTSVMGMKSETTIYVKGMRKRTEGGGFMGQPSLPTIEQCDLQRKITLNDKKKLYFIEPFSKQQEEVIDEDVKPVKKTGPVPVVKKDSAGGIITLYYNIIDTGERKKMYGFTARHIWTNQKMKPSPDACTMKDSIIIKTDGWYIDLREFNCPVRYAERPTMPATQRQPTCTDKFVTRRSGKGKLGFPLIEKRIIIMGNGTQKSEMETNLETIELITGKLDSMLFEIPPGYRLANSLEEMQEKFDVSTMIKDYGNIDKSANVKDNGLENIGAVTEEKGAGVLRIGVFQPKGDEQVTAQAEEFQRYIATRLTTGKVEGVAVSSEQDARTKKCDYILNTEFQKFKPASKLGGLIKAVKNADPNAASSFNIDTQMVLVTLADGSTRLTERVSGKFDGKPDDAAKKSLQEGCQKVLSDLK